MSSRFGKLTAVAAAAIAAIGTALLLGLFHKTARPAFAIEQAMEAMAKAKTVHVTGLLGIEVPGEQERDEPVAYELWARKGEDGAESGELRFEVADGTVVVVQDKGSYLYDPDKSTVLAVPGRAMSLSPWFGIAFDALRDHTKDFKLAEGKDEETGQDCAFVTCSYPPMSRSWWFQFDLQSKLPVRFKQWHNVDRKGTPAYDARKIVYDEQLGDELFEFEAPEAAKVVTLEDLWDDPDCGMSAEGLTEEQACVRIVERCWEAMIAGDWQLAERLWPALGVLGQKATFTSNPPVECVEVGKPFKHKSCDLGPIVPCRVRFKDGQVRPWGLVLKFREIGGKQSCVVAWPLRGFPAEKEE